MSKKRILFEISFWACICATCYLYFMAPEQVNRYHQGLDFVKSVKELVFG